MCSKKLIAEMYSQGKPVFSYPFKSSYLITKLEEPVSVQILIGVSKKKIKTAVKRNLIKRRIREAYRLNKGILTSILEKQNLQAGLVVNYIAQTEIEYAEIEKKICLILQTIAEELEKDPSFTK